MKTILTTTDLFFAIGHEGRVLGTLKELEDKGFSPDDIMFNMRDYNKMLTNGLFAVDEAMKAVVKNNKYAFILIPQSGKTVTLENVPALDVFLSKDDTKHVEMYTEDHILKIKVVEADEEEITYTVTYGKHSDQINNLHKPTYSEKNFLMDNRLVKIGE